MEKDREKMVKALGERAKRMKVDYVILDDYDFLSQSSDIADNINFAFAKQHKLIPVSLEGDVLTVAMEDPTDLYKIEQLELRTKKKIKPVLGDTDAIMSAINILFAEIQIEDVKIPILESEESRQMLAMIKPETIHWFTTVLLNGVKRGASDIHVETYENEIKIRYRIDGVISETSGLPTQMESQILTCLKTISSMKLEKRNVPQHGSFSIIVRQKSMRVRVSSVPTRYGERFILKIMDERQLLKQLDDLDFAGRELELIKGFLNHRQGLVIASGPSGSGITTTLYSLLMEIAKPEINIITIENPIEASLPDINQIEVNARVDFGYKECIKAAMEHAPDVLMLSRILDQETAGMVIEAALAGKLAFAGIYAGDSINAVTRLRDFGLEPYLVSTPIIGIISQRLARRVCPSCSQTTDPMPEVLKELEDNNIKPPYNLKAAVGCSRCLGTGYKGRIGIYEILPISDMLRSLILMGASKSRLHEQAVKEGMKSLYRDGLGKVAKGLTTYEEIKRVLME